MRQDVSSDRQRLRVRARHLGRRADDHAALQDLEGLDGDELAERCCVVVRYCVRVGGGSPREWFGWIALSNE